MGENQSERCSAYVVIPAPVFYDRDLPPSARLLYGLISNLCNDRGYCWAKNETLCRYLDCKERTLRELLAKLRDKQYIQIEQSNQGGTTVRRILLGAYANRPAEIRRPPGENPPPARQKSAGRSLLKNNLSNNNTPLTPQGEGIVDFPDLSELEALDPRLAEAVRDWLRYKTERRQAYKPQGLRALLTRVRQKAVTYDPEAVAELIYDCMANGYQGITWDRMRTPAQRQDLQEVNDW